MTAIIDEKHDVLSCPHCDGKLKVPSRRGILTANLDSSADLDDLKVKINDISKKLDAPASTKIEKEIEYPSFMPGEYCADGNCALGGIHKNKNYKRKPAKACKNCSQIAPKNAPRCAWCDQNEFEDLDDLTLKEIGIRLPAGHDDEGHDHHHDE